MEVDLRLLLKVICIILLTILVQSQNEYGEEPPEGYYAFIESPKSIPPKTRPPPYTHVNINCKNVSSGKKPGVTANNLCGDLNKGRIPKNPMRQNVDGQPYPFELIRNHALKFFSKTLPVLKADDTLPKVTQIIRNDPQINVEGNSIDRNHNSRSKRKTKIQLEFMDKVNHTSAVVNSELPESNIMLNSTAIEKDQRRPRKFCDGGGVFCTIYRALQGENSLPTATPLTAERREEISPVRYEGPPTPCPAKVEYATPVFAKNYQGSWRYVVQIPYEGYFTQTVEVTRCIQSRCHYLDGGCLSSPRWVSLLVAEIFYPTAEDGVYKASSTLAPSVQDFQAYQQYLQKRAGMASTVEFNDSNGSNSNVKGNHHNIEQHCDGHDELGCFQVRLYYDWFLIPGSCKCWRPDYFSKYVRRKTAADL